MKVTHKSHIYLKRRLKMLVLERAWVPSLVLGNKAGYDIASFPGHVLFTCGAPLYRRHHLEPIFCPL